MEEKHLVSMEQMRYQRVCVLSEKFSLEDIETPIPIDTSVEDWIKEIEETVKRIKVLKDSF